MMDASEFPIDQFLEILRNRPEVRRELQELLLRDYTREGEPSLLEILHDMLQELKQLRVDMDRRFEALQVDMDRRFEALQVELKQLRVDMDRRFETSQANMDRRFEAMLNEFQKVRRDVAAVSSRYGLRLEDIFREVYRDALKTHGIDPDSIRRLFVLDEDGVVVDPGEATDIDIYMHDGEAVAIEVKANVDQHDIRRFEKTIRLAEQQEGITITKKVIITLNITPKNRLKAERKGFIVISSDIWSDDTSPLTEGWN